MTTTIGSIRTFVGSGALHGERVVVLAVHRGEPDDAVIIRDDAAVGALRPGDLVEVAQIVPEGDDGERLTRVTCDARPDELGRALGLWRGPTESGFLLRDADQRRN